MIQKHESGPLRIKEYEKNGYWHIEILLNGQVTAGMMSKDEESMDLDFSFMVETLENG